MEMVHEAESEICNTQGHFLTAAGAKATTWTNDSLVGEYHQGYLVTFYKKKKRAAIIRIVAQCASTSHRSL